MSDLKRCTLCGGEADAAGMNGKVPMAKCRECGFVYAAMSDEEIAAANRCGEETKERYTRMQSAFDLAWFDALVRRFPGTNVLDVGCGNGLLLRRYLAAGWNVAGVDPAPWARTDAYRVFADMAQVPRDFYDVVMCTSVLEHIPDPAGMLKLALEVAKPGGIVYMSVPNFGSWAAKCRPERMRAQEVPHHCSFFTARDLRRLCARAGARSYRVRSYGLPLAWDFWRGHRLKVTAPSTPAPSAPASPTWKHRLVAKAYYWAGLWRGDKLELCVTKVA
ncbi:MAG: class I SAM-dependent methyltransferase [Sedimentisphaerales bacterium]|nr:class I SAM-dependent methyltransferase [Sedimentisphaerales bacterium]